MTSDFLKYLTGDNIHLAYSILVMFVLLIIGVIFYLQYKKPEKKLVPSPKISFTGIIEIISEALYSLTKSVVGRDSDKFYPLVGSVFFYILVSNLIGLIPGFISPTDNINTNASVAILVFVYYNYIGIRTHGLIKYLKHFAGPIIWIAPLLFAIEIISNFIRPVSLSLRLLGNIVGDHMVLSIFSDLTPWIIPIPFYFLGTLVCILQAFVFTLLSITYIALAQGYNEE